MLNKIILGCYICCIASVTPALANPVNYLEQEWLSLNAYERHGEAWRSTFLMLIFL